MALGVLRHPAERTCGCAELFKHTQATPFEVALCVYDAFGGRARRVTGARIKLYQPKGHVFIMKPGQNDATYHWGLLGRPFTLSVYEIEHGHGADRRNDRCARRNLHDSHLYLQMPCRSNAVCVRLR